ncbi:MAG: hypothetical protein Fur005_26600 [Roseiflexaceae bacterium]
MHEQQPHDPQALVLVCVVTNPADLQRIEQERWYRIPCQRAPQRIDAHYLAFFPTSRCGSQRWCIRQIWPITQVRLATRAELLPDQAEHARAHHAYYQFLLGQPIELPMAIPSRRLRRVSFIASTIERLYQAQDVAELWATPPTSVDVWGAGIGNTRRAIHPTAQYHRGFGRERVRPAQRGVGTGQKQNP